MHVIHATKASFEGSVMVSWWLSPLQAELQAQRSERGKKGMRVVVPSFPASASYE